MVFFSKTWLNGSDSKAGLSCIQLIERNVNFFVPVPEQLLISFTFPWNLKSKQCALTNEHSINFKIFL